MGGRALPFVRPEKMNLLRSLKGTGVLRTSVPFLQEGFRYLRVVLLMLLLSTLSSGRGLALILRGSPLFLQSRRVRLALKRFRMPPVRTNVTFSTSDLGRIMMGIG